MPTQATDDSRIVSRLPASWAPWCAAEFQKPYFRALIQFVRRQRESHEVFPPTDETFAALEMTPYDQVRVLLLGQDPYHDVGQAHGLCFSVRSGIKPPRSLVNVFKELEDDVGCPVADHGCLDSWAQQGVLLLNSVLTVRAHEPYSHRKQGWETFTDSVIRRVSEKEDPVVFVLWGNAARQKVSLIDHHRHFVLQSAHPSPLSARRGFFGSKPFSTINRYLTQSGQQPIDWRLVSTS